MDEMKKKEKDDLLELFLKPISIGSEIYKKIEMLRKTSIKGISLDDVLIEYMEIKRQSQHKKQIIETEKAQNLDSNFAKNLQTINDQLKTSIYKLEKKIKVLEEK